MTYPVTLCAMTVRRASFAERLDAAASAGFDSVGLALDQYRAARRDGLDDAAMRAMLRARGLRVAEMETPWDWADPARSEDGDALFRALEALECEQVNVVQFTAHPRERLGEPFARLCERAARLGVRVALEFMPFSEIRTLDEAWRLVEESGAPNAGVLLDSWHHLRSGGTTAGLAAVPPGRVFSVQINDALPTPRADLRHEARHLRLPPAGGALAFVRALLALGVTARMSVEVWSDDLERLPPPEAAAVVQHAAQRVLAEAGWPLPSPVEQ